MKRYLPLLTVVLFAAMSFSATSQVVVTIGNNNNPYSYPEFFPFNYYWYSTVSEALYTEAELLAGGWSGGPGKIQSLAWNVTYAYPWSNGDIQIFIKNSTDLSVSSGPMIPDDQFTLAWSGPAVTFMTTGWHSFTLNEPFAYDGTGIYIKVMKPGYDWDYPYTTFAKTDQTNPYRFRANYGDTQIQNLVNSLSTWSFRPDIRLEICNEPNSIVGFDIPEFVNLPASIPVNFNVARPIGEFDATVTVSLYDLDNNLVAELPGYVIPIGGANPQNGSGMLQIPTGNIPAGFYLVYVNFNTLDQCGNLDDILLSESLLVLGAGDSPCIVYPGDVTNDGICNYGDIKGLTNYIHDANLQASWLQGPARYRSGADMNPLIYLEWTPQASVPWMTPEGCYMDTDGNGNVNNFDFIAIKMNWFRSIFGTAKEKPAEDAQSFNLSQNFPNPFNPETSIQYTVAEDASVQLRVYNSAGELVRELVNDNKSAGTHTAKFGGADLASGTYIAVITMTASESGATYSKSIKMNLAK